MQSKRTLDTALLLALFLPWLVVLALHVREVARSGLAQPTFFVSQPAHADAYATVRGFRFEQRGDVSDLRVGDELRRLGDRDLRGVGNIGVDAAAIAEASDGRVAVTFQRDGAIQTRTVELAPAPVPWMRVPVLIAAALVAVIVLLRAPPAARPRLTYVAFMVMILAQTPFHGPSPVQTWLSGLGSAAGGGEWGGSGARRYRPGTDRRSPARRPGL